MARNRTRAQKTQAKTNFIRTIEEGTCVIAYRVFADGQSVTYRARVRFLADGRTELEQLGGGEALARKVFLPARMLPIEGYPDWFMVSGAPVVMNRWTRIISAFRRLMQMAPFQDV